MADLGVFPATDLEVDRLANSGHPTAGLACSDTFVTSGRKVLTGSLCHWLNRAFPGKLFMAPPDPLRLQCPLRLLRLEESEA